MAFVKVKKMPINQSVGQVLLHNQTGPNGKKVLKKGQVLTSADVETLDTLGKEAVYVAILDQNDIAENEAAQQLGTALKSDHLTLSTATTGRVNLIATTAGVLKINLTGLLALNEGPGITLATLPTNTVVSPKKIVGTNKIIPYSVSQQDLQTALTIIAEQAPIISLNPFTTKQAVLITTGSEAAQQKVTADFTPALRDRFAAYGAELIEGPYVAEDEAAISQALQWALNSEADIILMAGETSIMDPDDIAPRAIKAIGGEIIHHGVPVEPGNLLLLAYHGQTPLVGAPGCAKSKHFNVVDMVLPRLASGERLTRRDLIALGHGGYLLSK